MINSDQVKSESEAQIEDSMTTNPQGLVHIKPRINGQNVIFIFAIAMAMVAGGALNGMIATTLAQPSFIAYFKLTAGNSTSLIGATNGTFYAGGFFGVFFGAWAADKLGRRGALRLTTAMSILWLALLSGSVRMSMFIVFRFFSGFNASQLVTLTPLYQSEIAPPHVRGMMVGLAGIGNLVGYEIATWSGVGFFYAPDSANQWRFPFVIVGGLCIIVLICLCFVPESPRWLLMQGRTGEAEAVIRKIHTNRADPNHVFADLELTQMKCQLAEERELSVGYMEMFLNKKYRRRSLLCCLVGLLGQSTGVLVINNYGPFFYSMLGMDTAQQLFLSGGYISCSFAFAIIGIFIVDTTGRVKFMAWGVIGQVTCLIIEAALVANNTTGSHAMNIAGIFTFYLYIAIYGLTWDCTQFTYVAEIMPTHLRAKGVSLAIACLYLSDVGFLTGTLYAFTTIGWKYFLVFICIAPPLTVCLWIYAPETKGKTLEEIGALFGDQLATETLSGLEANWDKHHTQQGAEV